MSNERPLEERFPRIYKALKDEGHDAATAIRILLDAVRRDPYSRRWIRIICRRALY